MATTGSIYGTCKNSSGSTTSSYSTWIYWKRNSVDEVNNKSNITVYVRVQRTDGYNASAYNNDTKPSVTLKVGGSAKTPTISYIDTRNDAVCTFATWTGNVNHDSDGKLSLALSCSWSMTGASSLKSGSISGTATLDIIPRKSTLAASNGTLGTAQTLTVTRQSTSFTHTITAKCGSTSATVCSKSASTSISYTPPLTWANQNTTGTSVTVVFTITTYSGDTNIGSNTKTINCAIPSSVVPSVSLSVADVYTYRTDYGAYVQGKSKLQIGITAAGVYGSTIKSYKTTIDGKTYTAASVTTDILSGSGTLTITTTVTDSRGRSKTTTWDINVLAYAAPKISSLSVSRCNADGTANSSGAYLAVKFKTTVSALTAYGGNNSAIYTVQYKKTTDSEYTTEEATAYKDVYSVSDGVFVFAADAAASYNVILTVTDDFDPTPRSATGSSAAKAWSQYARGLGFAFGKIAEFAHTFEVAWRALFRNHVCVGEKEAHLDGKTGILLSSEGYIHIQRTSAQNYNPYIAFLLDDETAVTAQLRYNSSTRILELLGASSYKIDGNTEAKEIFSTHSDTAFIHEHPSGMAVGFGVGSGGTNHGIYNQQLKKWLFKCDGEDVFLGAAAGEIRPYYRAGDSVNVWIKTAGYVTNSGKDVSFVVPLCKPYLGTPTITAATLDGFKMRQNNAYTHGSSASAHAKPSSYTAERSAVYGICVTASFSSATNVTNNSAIGIYWSGTITFS